MLTREQTYLNSLKSTFNVFATYEWVNDKEVTVNVYERTEVTVK